MTEPEFYALWNDRIKAMIAALPPSVDGRCDVADILPLIRLAGDEAREPVRPVPTPNVIVEFDVPLRDCPPSDWDPLIHRDRDGLITGVSVPGTAWGWGAGAGQRIDSGKRKVVAEKEVRGEVVLVRLVFAG